MEVYKMHEAKTNLSKMVEKALAGESIFISNRNEIKVQLTPVKMKLKKRKGGQLMGKIFITEDFDVLPKEISDAFEGKMP